MKGLFRKNKKNDGAVHCKSVAENMTPSRDVEPTDPVGEWIIDVSRQFG